MVVIRQEEELGIIDIALIAAVAMCLLLAVIGYAVGFLCYRSTKEKLTGVAMRVRQRAPKESKVLAHGPRPYFNTYL